MMNMPNVPILIGDKKDKKDKKDPSLTPPLENSPIPSSSPNPSPREPQPPLEEGIYICRRAYDCPKDKHFFVQKNESVHVLGWAPMSKTWVVVEKSQGEEEENEEKGKEEMKRTIGFCPLICLVPKMEKKEGEQEGEGEEWSKYQEELEKVINEADLPLPLERDFEIVKPLLANTPFLKHVGLSTTVKTLKVNRCIHHLPLPPFSHFPFPITHSLSSYLILGFPLDDSQRDGASSHTECYPGFEG